MMFIIYYTIYSSLPNFNFTLGVEVPGAYRIVLSTDSEAFGGHNLVDTSCIHMTTPEGFDGRQNYLQCYLPSRTAFIFAKDP